MLVKLIEQPSKTAQPLGHITRVLGEHAAPGMETDIAIHSHGLPFEFPSEVVAEAEAFGHSVSAAAKRGREDLRDLPLVTIDGEDASRFRRRGLLRAVARGQLALAGGDRGRRELRRTESGGRSRGAAARHLGLFSKPGPADAPRSAVERLVLAQSERRPAVHGLRDARERRWQSHARANSSKGLMRSAARLTYTKVAAYLANPAASYEPEVTALGSHLQSLYGVFKALHRQRPTRGASTSTRRS